MPFHRFENFEVHHLNPHLSTGEGPVIEGDMVQIPRGAAYALTINRSARYAGVKSTAVVEAHIDKNGAADNGRG